MKSRMKNKLLIHHCPVCGREIFAIRGNDHTPSCVNHEEAILMVRGSAAKVKKMLNPIKNSKRMSR